MTILMGDFNAKIGRDNTGYEEVMGKQGLGEMKENGEKFADLCSLNQLVIGGSIFPHKRTHKATWRSPDHVTENQIDHACTVEPRFNEVAGDRPNLFVKWRVRYIEVLFHTFYYNFGRDIEIISFVISRISLDRGLLNRGSTASTKSSDDHARI